MSLNENIESIYIFNKNTGELITKININNGISTKINIDKKLSSIIKKLEKDKNKKSFFCFHLSSVFINVLIIKNSNIIFSGIFKNKIKVKLTKMFLLYLFCSYENTFLKIGKIIKNNEYLFPKIYSNIFITPFTHNFNNVTNMLIKKLDIVIYGNTEYTSSLIIELTTGNVLCNTGESLPGEMSEYHFSHNKEFINEIIFQGAKLRDNYNKNEKNCIDFNFLGKYSIKINFRATFPRPIFFIKYLPILDGLLIVHIFNQFKLSKTLKVLPGNNNSKKYDDFQEIEIDKSDLEKQLMEENLTKIYNLERLFYEYFTILKDNKSKDIEYIFNYYNYFGYNLKYLNKKVLLFLKNIIMEYNFKDENDLFEKIKKRLNNESISCNSLVEESLLTKSTEKTDPLEFQYNNFMKEFQNINNELSDRGNDSIKMNNIKIIFSNNEMQNLNEQSDTNITGIISLRNFGGKTSNINNNNQKKVDNTERDPTINNVSTSEPFNIDVTGIENNIDISQNEWGVKSILFDKNKVKNSRENEKGMEIKNPFKK